MDALSQQQSLGDGSIGGTKVGEKADTTILEEDEGDHIFLPDGDRGDNILGKENFIVLNSGEIELPCGEKEKMNNEVWKLKYESFVRELCLLDVWVLWYSLGSSVSFVIAL